MNKCCENCGHCFIDFSVGLLGYMSVKIWTI